VADQKGIFLKSYGEITSMAVEPIEKKPFYHFMPGSKTISLGFWGCSFNCPWCENFSISQKEVSGVNKIYPNKIVELAKENNCPIVCMTYSEPIVQYEYLLDLAKVCHKNDLKFIIKTNGFASKKAWKEILNNVDALNIDFKWDFKGICNIPDGGLKVVSKNIIDAIKFGKHVELTIPVIQNVFGEIPYTFIYFVGCFNKYLKNIPIHLIKIFPHNKSTDPPADSLFIDKVYKYLRASGFLYVYVNSPKF
jgi:pyruvate formate lyase activating enzyme